MSHTIRIPYSRQEISEEEIKEVVRVLRSEYLTQGPEVLAFEQALCAACSVPYLVAVSNGTAALHLACQAMGIGPQSRVWTSPITFVASANCALYLGATIDFVDVEGNTGNMCVLALEEKLILAEKRNVLPQLVIPVHFSGRVCDMERIAGLSQRYGFSVLEDACHALGAEYSGGDPVGSGRWSRATVFSFHPVKSITTGEGGAIATRDEALAKKIAMLRTHGITKDKESLYKKDFPEWYYEEQVLGFNYRMNDLQAALGRSQLQRLPQFISRRRELAQRYDKVLEKVPVVRPTYDPCSAWHIYVTQITGSEKRAGNKRDQVYSQLRENGIGAQVHYYPVHLQPLFAGFGFLPGEFPVAEQYSAQALSLPLYPSLSEKDQDFVVRSLAEACS